RPSTSTIRPKAATSTTCRTPRASSRSRWRCRIRSASAAPTAASSSAASEHGAAAGRRNPHMTNVLALAHGLDLLALQRRAPARYPLLLESVASGTALGRWDMLLVADGARITLGRDGITRRSNGMSAEGDARAVGHEQHVPAPEDRKSTRLNSSHVETSYAVYRL